MKPRSTAEIEKALDEAQARGERPAVAPNEVPSLLNVVLARTRAAAARSSQDLADAAERLSRVPVRP